MSDWRESALCAQVDPVLFFPAKGESGKEARAICARCDVRDACLTEALEDNVRDGIWGGTNDRERRKLRAAREPAA